MTKKNIVLLLMGVLQFLNREEILLIFKVEIMLKLNWMK